MRSALYSTLSAAMQHELSMPDSDCLRPFSAMAAALKNMALTPAMLSLYQRQWGDFALALDSAEMLKELNAQHHSLHALHTNMRDAFIDREKALRNKLHRLIQPFSWANSIATEAPNGESRALASRARLAISHHLVSGSKASRPQLKASSTSLALDSASANPSAGAPIQYAGHQNHLRLAKNAKLRSQPYKKGAPSIADKRRSIANHSRFYHQESAGNHENIKSCCEP